MTYAQYGKIEATDYNVTLVGANISNVANRLNTVWSVGNNNAGYGQPDVGNVTVGNRVNHIEWDNLINTTANVAIHQNSTITSVTPPVAGDKILYTSAIPTNLTTIYTNRLNAASQGSTDFTNSTNSNNWNSKLIFTQTATFANGDAARYFFNSGGQLSISCSHPSGPNTIDATLNTLASEVGNVFLSSPITGAATIAGTAFNGITQIGGGGNSSISANTGYYALTTSNVTILTQTSTIDSSTIQIVTKSNGTQGSYNDAGNVITFYTTWQESPSGFTAAVNTNTRLTATYPSTSKLANSWGFVTLSSGALKSYGFTVTPTTWTGTLPGSGTTTTTTAGPSPSGVGAIFGFGTTVDVNIGYTSITNLVDSNGVVAADQTALTGTPRSGLAAAGYGGDKAIFGFGIGGPLSVSITNLVSSTGVVATDTTGVGTPRYNLAAAGYGGDKAIFGYGFDDFAFSEVSITNLVNNLGVVATDTTGVGTPRLNLAAAGYGGDKAIFGFGGDYNATIYYSLTNLVNNLGVVATDTTGVGTGRDSLAAAGYGGDKAIFGYGYNDPTFYSLTNLVNNLGVVATDTTGVGTARAGLAAAGYGGDKAIFGYGAVIIGPAYTSVSVTNLVNNLGVVAADVTGVGTARNALAAASLGGAGPTPSIGLGAIFGFGGGYLVPATINIVNDLGVVAADQTVFASSRAQLAAAGFGVGQAIFGFGEVFASEVDVTNLVSSLGVVASDSTGVGTARYGLAAAGYGGDKAIFGFGAIASFIPGIPTPTSITNLVTNLGVVATDQTALTGTARYQLAAASYGYDKAIFGFGLDATYVQFSTTNLVTNLGVVAADQTALTGTARAGLAAAGYGGDKAIFGFGYSGPPFTGPLTILSTTNLVSNTGVVATDTTGVGTVRTALAAAGYDGDKAIFGFGTTSGVTVVSITNLVNSLGVVATDQTALTGTARASLAAASIGT